MWNSIKNVVAGQKELKLAVKAYEEGLREDLKRENASLTGAVLQDTSNWLAQEAFKSGKKEAVKSAQEIAGDAARVLGTEKLDKDAIRARITQIESLLGNKARIRDIVREELRKKRAQDKDRNN
ncbi:MAG: hypothetical protein AAB899_01005 [Patescibacteria group bacterium]